MIDDCALGERGILGQPAARRPRPSQLVLVLLLAVHAAMLGWISARSSPTIDEWGHLAAGLRYWIEGRHDMYRVNPPLVRIIAAMPLLWSGRVDVADVARASGYYRSEVAAAFDLYWKYGVDSFPLFTRARMACIPLSLLGAYVCYRWARELYGERSGLIAMGLWCFCPNVLAHASLITPDAGATSIALAANYLFWGWLRRPDWSTTILVGVALGAALLTKFTWIVLPPVWAAVWAINTWSTRFGWRKWLYSGAKLGAIAPIAIALVNSVYEFQGSFRPLGEYQFVSGTLRVAGSSAPLGETPKENRFSGTMVGRLPMPFPEDYLLGIDRQKIDFERESWSYLRGVWQKQGWWYYYLYAMTLKMPLGACGLVIAACAMTVVGARRNNLAWELFLLAPAAVLLVFVSTQTGFSRHLRYVLPCFPYLFIFASKPFSGSLRPGRFTRLVCAGFFIWSVASSVWIFPHSLSYFNEIIGGPRRGHEHLLSSNLDWGQDLIFVRGWLDRHSQVKPRGVALCGILPPQLIGLETLQTPEEPLPGWYVMSVDRILQPACEYRFFFRFEPVASIGYSLRIYHISLEEANRVRRELGLPELAG